MSKPKKSAAANRFDALRRALTTDILGDGIAALSNADKGLVTAAATLMLALEIVRDQVVQSGAVSEPDSLVKITNAFNRTVKELRERATKRNAKPATFHDRMKAREERLRQGAHDRHHDI